MARRSKIVVAVWLPSRVVDCWRLTEAQLQRLRRALPQAEVVYCEDQAAFLKVLPQAQVGIVRRFQQAWLKQAPHLEWLATPAAGRDYFEVERKGLKLTYGSFHGRLMGQTVAAMVLAENRGISDAIRAAHAGDEWPLALMNATMRSLEGSHAVIVGFGNIGRWIGRYLKPFGVRITGVRRHPRAAARPEWFETGDRVAGVGQLERLLPATDHLILVLPSTPESDNLLSAGRLALLPSTAVVYNVGRGNAVDEAALARALRRGALRGAYLDVFKREPLPAGSPLRQAPRAVLMPHSSSIAASYLDLFLDEFIPQFKQHYDG